MAENQNKHVCACDCGEFIVIKIHHRSRGIPKFANGHTSRVKNPMSGRCGDKNPNFKNGRYTNQNGYVCVLIPGPGRSQYELEHRQKMQAELGRELEMNEVVHHKNRKKDDNDIHNLQVLTSAEHGRHHANKGEIGFLFHRTWKKRAAVPGRDAG